MKLSTLFLLAVVGATAQAASPDPADPRATVPAVTYLSAFTGYAAQGEITVADWREVNAEMERLGGHRGHVGDASAGSDPDASPSAVHDHRHHQH